MTLACSLGLRFGQIVRNTASRRNNCFASNRQELGRTLASKTRNRSARRTYSTDIKSSKIAQAIQEESSRALFTHTTPSAAQALGLAQNEEMAPPRRPTKGAKQGAKPISIEPRPSASILLISPQNQILLLHRVKTSSSFPSAHVFPGGNLSANHDGIIPDPTDPKRHVDSEVYRIGAVRECFEESGILLARNKDGGMLIVEEKEKQEARNAIHSNTLKFKVWVESKGGVVDTNALIPFTRWVTPIGVPRRFTTQMYVYFWPLNNGASTLLPVAGQENGNGKEALVATSDGGKEHTEAIFRSCHEWTEMATRGDVIMFPPQYYLIWQLGKFLNNGTASVEELEKQRDLAKQFLKGTGSNNIPWAEKCISPQTLGMYQGKAVLDLSKPGPELKDSGRAGEGGEVVLVKFSKAGPREVSVAPRKEVLEGMRVEAAKKKEKEEGSKL